MPGAYDAAPDAGNDDTEVSEGRNGPGDAEAAVLADSGGSATQGKIVARVADEPDLPGPPPVHQAIRPDVLRSPSSFRDADLPVTSIEAGRPEDDSALMDSVITESLHETLDAFKEWFAERAVKFAANAVYPGLGHVINIALTIKEIASDAEGLASLGSARNLHVPLFHFGGLAIDLNVHLSGAEGSEDDAPQVSGFLAPANDGLFGGWEIEVDRHPDSEQKDASATEHDAQPVEAEPMARLRTEQAERSRGREPPAAPVLGDDLSLVRRKVKEPGRRAVVLREAARRLRTRLFALPELAAEPVLVIYDPRSGLGMWLVNPDLPGDLPERRIALWLNPATGMTIVSIA